MDAALQTAFRATDYRLATQRGEILLRVDQPAARLAALLRASGAPCAALLTAFNPDARRSTSWRNLRAQQQLHADLVRSGCSVLVGRNEDPRQRWPVEPSFLALGLRLAEARRIAARYRQAAFLWVNADGIPRLMETAARLPYRR